MKGGKRFLGVSLSWLTPHTPSGPCWTSLLLIIRVTKQWSEAFNQRLFKSGFKIYRTSQAGLDNAPIHLLLVALLLMPFPFQHSGKFPAGHCDVLLFSLHVTVVEHPKGRLTPRRVYTETEILSCETVPPSTLCLLINIISLFSAWKKTYPTPTNSTGSEQTIAVQG